MHRGYSRLIATALIVLAACLAAFSVRGETAVERGKYLVAIMDCTGCHTTGALAGQPDPAMFLAGSTIGFEVPGYGVFYPPNLTPDAKTGLGAWSEQQIVDAIRTGVRPDGRGLAPIMPWPSYAALTDDDAEAVAAYLKSLPPFSHAPPPPAAAGETAPAPYLTVKMPE
jgi:mono/diheme cytochrome c family protein